jgi:crossover junction endodeoxyribonuclease RuvC
MIILGLDPGFDRVGFGVVNFVAREFEYLGSGIIKTNPNQDFYSRLAEIQSDLKQIIKQYKPELACVEKLFFAKNVATAMQVAEARGVINLELYNHSIDILQVAPTTVKSAITGNGNADKQSVEFMVKKILRTPDLKAIDDACDALGMAIFAGNNYRKDL